MRAGFVPVRFLSWGQVMPLVKLKSTVSVDGKPIGPGTFKREELGSADIGWLVEKNVAEIVGNRLWDTMLPDDPTPEQYAEEIARMQQTIETQAQQVDAMKRTADDLREELKKAADNRPLNRYHAPDAQQTAALETDRDYWKQTAERRAKEIEGLRERNDHYAGLLSAGKTEDPGAGPDEPSDYGAGGGTGDAPTATPAPNAPRLSIVDDAAIGTTHGGSPIRATTKRFDKPE